MPTRIPNSTMQRQQPFHTPAQTNTIPPLQTSSFRRHTWATGIANSTMQQQQPFYTPAQTSAIPPLQTSRRFHMNPGARATHSSRVMPAHLKPPLGLALKRPALGFLNLVPTDAVLESIPFRAPTYPSLDLMLHMRTSTGLDVGSLARTITCPTPGTARHGSQTAHLSQAAPPYRRLYLTHRTHHTQPMLSSCRSGLWNSNLPHQCRRISCITAQAIILVTLPVIEILSGLIIMGLPRLRKATPRSPTQPTFRLHRCKPMAGYRTEAGLPFNLPTFPSATFIHVTAAFSISRAYWLLWGETAIY